MVFKSSVIVMGRKFVSKYFQTLCGCLLYIRNIGRNYRGIRKL